ncbi:dUTP diphosphatase [Bacillus massiliigorillae]|uniref:dUTP diphosphatase n=1 Tax=Bacillus massiliigorillae TaxID=1243664 RepID=UPI0003A6B99A|nr:dUTP diphosphatase [Bacillus massiliigorillae]
MNTAKLFTIQEVLDQRIEKAYKLQDECLMDKKIVALLAELGSIANATRCYKYWDEKEEVSKGKILERYVNGMFYILSIGCELGFQNRLYSECRIHIGEQDVATQVLHVFEAISILRVRNTFEIYRVLYFNYLHLADLLGLSQAEVEEAYIAKSDVHLKRLQEDIVHV